jgi:hypothetical protein
MYPGKIDECRYGKDRIMVTHSYRYEQGDHHHCRSRSGRGCDQKNLPVPPMEKMAFSQVIAVLIQQPGSRIEQSVANVDSPRSERQQQRDPCRHSNVCNPSECKRPYDGHRWGVETGQMPETNRRRGIDDAAIADFTLVGLRICQGKSHYLDCKISCALILSHLAF